CRLDCLFGPAQAERVSTTQHERSRATPPGRNRATPPERGRATQQERSRATQQRLLDATVDCLIEHGWARTTTTLIADRAGLSRGAQLHHSPTKTALVLAAITHLSQRRAADLTAEAAQLPTEPSQERVGRVVDMLAAAFTGPLFVAAL